MITEEEFIEKVSELMDKTKLDALESAKNLYNSGAINKDDPDYQGNYVLPRMFMMAYASRMRWQWAPLVMKPHVRKMVKNWEHFI